MDNQEAKFILQSYRPGGLDASDPVFQEALDLSRKDPVLGEWLKAEQTQDAILSKKIRSVPTPPDLRASILAGGNIPVQNKMKPRWIWLLAASLLIVLIPLFMFFSPTGERGTMDQETFVSGASQIMDNGFELVQTPNDYDQVQEWLSSHQVPHPSILPVHLARQPAIGCQYFTIHGHKVSLICFQLKDGNAVHLMVILKSILRDPPPMGNPVFGQHGSWQTASWSDFQNAYLLLANQEPLAFKKLL